MDYEILLFFILFLLDVCVSLHSSYADGLRGPIFQISTNKENVMTLNLHEELKQTKYDHHFSIHNFPRLPAPNQHHLLAREFPVVLLNSSSIKKFHIVLFQL